MNRRHFLTAASALIVSGVTAPAGAVVPDNTPRQLGFQCTHTGECIDVVYWEEGHYLSDATVAIDHVLRDFRTGDIYPIDHRLLDLLYSLRSSLKSIEPFHVISGYRSPETNAALHRQSNGVATKSLHMEGMAIDIRLPGRSIADVHRAALNLKAGGVGYYPSSDFVHVDVGRVRRW